MANRMPSMLALLGLLAFAGYQNRDKIGAAIKDAQRRRGTPGEPTSGLDNVLGGVGDFLDTSKGRGGLPAGLNDLLDGSRPKGQAKKADSWIRPGSNRGPGAREGEDAVGAEAKRTTAR